MSLRLRRHARLIGLMAPLMVVGLLLSGCSGTSGDKPLSGLFSSDIPVRCPKVHILGAAVTLTQFAPGDGRDLTDITSELRVADFHANCVQDVDPKTGIGTVTVNLSPGIEAARGPANKTGKASFRYFVSVTDLNQKVLNKQVFDMTIGFDRNTFRSTTYDQPVTLTFPIKPPLAGDSYAIYIGLQLDKEELHYNQTVGPALLGG